MIVSFVGCQSVAVIGFVASDQRKTHGFELLQTTALDYRFK